jgi:sugar lactone lactonase YvrE
LVSWKASPSITVDIFLANQYTNSIDRMSPNGVITTYDSVAQVPSGMAISNDGKLYVEMSSRANTTGVGLGTIISMTQPEVSNPFVSNLDYPGETQLTFDSDNNLYVSDFNQGTLESAIKCISPAGVITGITEPNLYDATTTPLVSTG